ncbi:MAG: hypothetical protein PGN11_20615, partial [Quadrisphaera sp.]
GTGWALPPPDWWGAHPPQHPQDRPNTPAHRLRGSARPPRAPARPAPPSTARPERAAAHRGPAPGGRRAGARGPARLTRPPPPEQRRRRRGGVVALVVAAVLLVAALGGGAWWVLRPDDSTPGGHPPPRHQCWRTQPPRAHHRRPRWHRPPAWRSRRSGRRSPWATPPGSWRSPPDGRFAYIANRDAGVVTVIDTAVNQVTARIPVEAGPPQFLSFSPDGGTA